MKNIDKKPTVFCNGEELPWNKLREKKVIAITFKYLTKAKDKKIPGILGLLGRAKLSQEVKEETVNDPRGITVIFSSCDPVLSFNFWEKSEFEKIRDYDDRSLFKRDLMITKSRYQINIHVDNVLSIICE